jgi:hypothetical protein
MANKLNKTGIVSLSTIKPWHVSQSVDAFTGLNDYDITLSGSLTVTGSVYINFLTTASNVNVVTINPITGQLFSTSSNSFNSVTNITTSINNNISNYYTSSVNNAYTSSNVVNNYTSSTTTNNLYTSSVTNNYYTSSVNNTYTSSTVNNLTNLPAPSNQYVQYNSGSTFGASLSFQYIYTSESLQQGNTTRASGIYSHAEGKGTLSLGISSHAEGQETSASGDYSHAEGYSNKALGTGSHAEGILTISSGFYSHAEGSQTTALEQSSHAEGFRSISSGSYSHAEGAVTISKGQFSHAEGLTTMAGGQSSHAEGESTLTEGIGSHAEGLYTTASGDYQHVSGMYNIPLTSPGATIIGNGSSARRSNIIYASGSTFQTSASLNLSGSFVPQYRYLGSVQVSGVSPGILTYPSDYNVTFLAAATGMGNKNEILLPTNPQTGSIIYLQRISTGTAPCRISGSGTHTINGTAGYTFPTGSYARRMFVFWGSGWYTEPNPII